MVALVRNDASKMWFNVAFEKSEGFQFHDASESSSSAHVSSVWGPISPKVQRRPNARAEDYQNRPCWKIPDWNSSKIALGLALPRECNYSDDGKILSAKPSKPQNYGVEPSLVNKSLWRYECLLTRIPAC